MAENKIITYSGLNQYEEELHNLKVYRRKEVAQKIKEASEQGDLSENAEYDAAKDEQRDLESRIEELEKLLKNVTVVDEEDIEKDKVSVGCKVVLYDFEYDEELEFSLVGSTEANSSLMMISNESPLGRALMGHKIGDTISYEIDDGVAEYKIMNIIIG